MAIAADVRRAIDRNDDDLEALLTEHRYWRGRLREAIDKSVRVRTDAAAVRAYRRDVSSQKLRTTVC